MHAGLNTIGRTIVPTLRYQDVAAAIDWLCNVFGFEEHLVVEGEDGAVRYAELTFGDGMVMVGPVEDDGADTLSIQAPRSGSETQTCYLFVADVRAHCTRAREAGAEIVLDVDDEASSGRGYSCRDFEGHVWNFGTYDPWKRQTATERRRIRFAERVGAALRYSALVIGFMAMTFASAAVVAWSIGVNGEPPGANGTAADAGARRETRNTAEDRRREFVERALNDAREQLGRERAATESADRAARNARDQAAQERGAREAAERAIKEVQAQLAAERSAREQHAKAAADRSANDLREPTMRERAAIDGAERIMRETREQLVLAERAAEEARAQLAAEREARQATERETRQAKDLLAKERSAREAEARASKDAREELAKEKERAARRAPPPRRRTVEQPAGPTFLWQ